MYPEYYYATKRVQPHIVKTPSWLRILQIIIGAISIILSGYVLIFPGLAITTVQILSIVLLLVGIESIGVSGAFFRYLRTTSSRLSNIALGSLAIAFSILLMALLHTPPILFAISLGGLALLFNGGSKNHRRCRRLLGIYFKMV